MRYLLVAVAAFLVACSSAEETPADAMTGECSSAADCDDNDACTTDTCSASHTCEHAAKAIDDSIDCTTDACDPATGDVTHTPVDTMCEQDGKTCTVATCSAATGCSETPTPSMCSDDATCSTETCDPTAAGADATTGCKVTLDDSACSDAFSCTTNTCTPSALAADATTGCLVVPQDNACGDSISCTVDTCNPTGAGADAAGCVNQTMDNLCEVDGKSCTVATCSAATGCSETPTDALCDDDATCSTDTCSATGPGATGCEYVLNNAMCTDSAECSTDACSPGMAGADATTGCYYAADMAACNANATCGGQFDCVCNGGYTGDGVTTCTGITCDALTDPDDGSVATSNGGLYPSTATYTCDPGFAPIGGSTRTCNTDGTWSGDAPGCEPTFFVVRVGDGGAALSSDSTAVFLEERNSAGTILRTFGLPTATSGSNAPFTLSGSSNTEGGLSLSADEKYVTLAGYATAPGLAKVKDTINIATDATSTNRVVARVTGNGTIDTSTVLTDAFSGDNVRAACSVDGSAFWVTGTGTTATSGVQYATFGTTGAPTKISNTVNNLRHTHVFASQLYVSSGAGSTTRGVLAVGTGTPITTGQTATQVAPFSSTLSPDSFAVLDLDPDVPGIDTIYVAVDQGASSGKVNIQKWTNSGSTWSQVTAFAPTVTGTSVSTLGLAVWFDSNDELRIVVTTTETPSRILMIVDDGTNSTPAATVLATASANTAFRGVARSPTN